MNGSPPSNAKILIRWIFQLLGAAILLQTLYFKFTGAAESVYIFETIGIEPWGRYGSGIVELCAGILLLVPSTAWIGAILALFVMFGAIFFHLTVLGIEVMEDGGTLFYLAITVSISSAVVLYLQKDRVKTVIERFRGTGPGIPTQEPEEDLLGEDI